MLSTGWLNTLRAPTEDFYVADSFPSCAFTHYAMAALAPVRSVLPRANVPLEPGPTV